MCQFFPILDKYPFLLIFCWGIRNIRIYTRMCVNKCEKVWFRLSVRMLDIKEKIKGLVRRGSEAAPEEPAEPEEKEPEDEAREHSAEAEDEAQRYAAEDEVQGHAAEPEVTEGDMQIEEFKD